MVCLANSRKPPSGRCIAGKEYEGAQKGRWIRPVSARPEREVSEEERRYENGKTAQLLDIITIPLDTHVPNRHQTENYVLADDYYWSKKGVATWNQIRGFADAYDADFWRDAESTHYGLNDKVPENVANNMQNSLKLVFLPNLRVEVRHEEGYEGRPGRKRVRARFELSGRQYLLAVTDPVAEEKFLMQGIGTYNPGEAALCISLADVWNGYAFRLAASIITPDQCRA